MRTRIALMFLLTIAVVAVYEAVTPPANRLLFPSTEVVSVDSPVLRELPGGAADQALDLRDLTDVEGLEGGGETWLEVTFGPVEDGRAHQS